MRAGNNPSPGGAGRCMTIVAIVLVVVVVPTLCGLLTWAARQRPPDNRPT